MSAMVDSLREVPLFSDLSARDLKRLADSMHVMTFSSGKEVVAEGRGGAAFFVILEGAARVTQGGEDRGLLTAGDYFGEMALILDTPRLGSARALGPVQLLALSKKDLMDLMHRYPSWGEQVLPMTQQRLATVQTAAAASGAEAAAQGPAPS
jgi:CRP-like cAMP-binding protein